MAGLAALAIGYVLSQFYRSFLAVLTPALTAELGATKAELSMASGAWFITFALMQFAVGVCLDRFGPRRTAAFLMIFCGGGGALLFAAATTPSMIILAMVLNGAGFAAVLMASVFIFAKNYAPARLAIMISWLMGFGMLGNVVGSAPLAAAAEAYGWREVMLGLAVFTILVGLAIFFLVRDPEREQRSSADQSGLRGYIELLRLRALWPIFPLMAIGYAPAAGIRGLWAGPYLADIYGADTILIGQIALFMALAMVAGNFLYGPLDTLTGTRKWVAVIGNVIGLAALAWLATFPLSSLTLVTILLIIIGVAGNSYGLLVAHGRAFVPAHLTGRGVTLLNFFSIGGVGTLQFATGAVFSSAASQSEPIAGYQALFLFYTVMMAAALIIYLFCRDAPPSRG